MKSFEKAPTRKIEAREELQITWASAQEKNPYHTTNQDALLASDTHHVFGVADGLGGSRDGDVASRETLKYIEEHAGEVGSTMSAGEAQMLLEKILKNADLNLKTKSEAIIKSEGIEDFVKRLDRKKWKYYMNTTVSALVFFTDRLKKKWAIIGHAGDSRIYKIDQTSLSHLTIDDDFLNAQPYTEKEKTLIREHIAQAKSRDDLTDIEQLCFDKRNRMTQSVGMADARFQMNKLRVKQGDMFLLVSDGITKHLSDQQIATIIWEAKTLEEAADRLVEEASTHSKKTENNEMAYGPDDLSVLLVKAA